ncbi:3-isopropylmalate dehydratase small subunit [Pseudorhodoferax sp. Leaf265]|uniref:3-isopropylmalate dehydratase small subunit n=1 Tax=Pseudorhodoferax sp. Leaf265 TaxID=1736315 RepID=UPI0007008431|nr:3-isopropylmalate dehydratase small subunit [Pseudorhodoferax sp. Leaf265]KQP15984.1 3-isopropylmalate dehydratase [Pseudorhodoferax sp. Leaf265]
MTPIVRLQAIACALPQINIDTDQVFPARYMKEARRPPSGYAPYLFHDLRRGSDGELREDFPLNAPINQGVGIIAAGRNFGSGSSREGAVYALVDAGVRCVLAPSYGDIFAANAVNNGLLPARVDEHDMEVLFTLLAPGGVRMNLDLQACNLTVERRSFDFTVDPVWRTRLLNGWDEIDMTRRHAEDIAAWCRHDRELRPWAQLPFEPAAA